MKTTTYIHPNLILFWNSLAYPKLLFKFGFTLLVIILIPAYIFSRPEMFVEHNATIISIEFKRGINMRSSDSLNFGYRYVYENKLYEKSGSHFLPKGYPEEKTGEYILKWKQMHPIGSNVKIIVNASHPGYSWFSQLSGFTTGFTSWFVNFYTYFFVYYWIFPMLILTLISMAAKYFLIQSRNGA